MSRRLPLVGSTATGTSLRTRVQDVSFSTVHIAGVARVAVIEGRQGAGAEPFVAALQDALSSAGQPSEVRRGDAIDGQVLLVLIGSDTPRLQRAPLAQASWSRADVLLTLPSVVVAQALSAALAPERT